MNAWTIQLTSGRRLPSAVQRWSADHGLAASRECSGPRRADAGLIHVGGAVGVNQWTPAKGRRLLGAMTAAACSPYVAQAREAAF
jgi:hypothetical protein